MIIYGTVENIEHGKGVIKTQTPKLNIKVDFDVFSPIVRLSLIDSQKIQVKAIVNLKDGNNIVEDLYIVKEKRYQK